MKYYLILPYCDYVGDLSDGVVVAVDGGVNYCLKHNIPFTYALGDFDSISEEAKSSMESLNVNIIRLPREKDDTDTEYAIKHFGISNTYIAYGGINGKRIEHLFANARLTMKYNITFIDSISILGRILEYMTFTNLDYKYISFFAEKDSVLSLNNFKYNLDNYKLSELDNLCISNELNKGANLSFQGKGIYILSKSDN